MRAYRPADYAPAQLLVESSAFVPAPCHWQPAQNLDLGFAAHARQPPHDAAARAWEPPHDSPARVWEAPQASSRGAWQGPASRGTGYDGGWPEADGQPHPGTSLWDPSSSRGGAAEQALFPEACAEAYGAHAPLHAPYRAAGAWRAPGSAPYEHRGYGEAGWWAERGHPATHPGGALAGPGQASRQAAPGPASVHAAHALDRGHAHGAGTGLSGVARLHAAENGDSRYSALDRVGAAAAAPEWRDTIGEERAALQRRAGAAEAGAPEWRASVDEESAELRRRANAAEARAAAAVARAEELALALAARDTELATLHRCN